MPLGRIFEGLRKELASFQNVALGRGPDLYIAFSHYRRHGDWRILAADVLRIYPDRKMLNLRIDSDAKTLHVEVQLRGQAERIVIDAEGLEVVDDPAGAAVTVRSVKASPGWLGAVLKPLKLEQRRIPVPPEYAELAKLAI